METETPAVRPEIHGHLYHAEAYRRLADRTYTWRLTPAYRDYKNRRAERRRLRHLRKAQIHASRARELASRTETQPPREAGLSARIA